MELWTFVNKETGDVIRFDKIETGDSEFGDLYYFINHTGFPTWFVSKKESIDIILKYKSLGNDMHPKYSQFFETPEFKKVNLDEYEIKKIII